GIYSTFVEGEWVPAAFTFTFDGKQMKVKFKGSNGTVTLKLTDAKTMTVASTKGYLNKYTKTKSIS
ncbi:MAG: hypothetical protein J7559_13445, partial [Cohnella sp.]|nr:hypothetical protein [Cohnella sp.]